MSTQPQTPFNVSEFLVRARQACQETKPKLSVQEIWFRFRTAGGHDGHSAVKSWLYGWTKPDVDQYVVLASVLNQHLAEHGRTDALCPVFNFSPVGDGDGASNDLDIASDTTYSNHPALEQDFRDLLKTA